MVLRKLFPNQFIYLKCSLRNKVPQYLNVFSLFEQKKEKKGYSLPFFSRGLHVCLSVAVNPVIYDPIKFAWYKLV